MQSFILGLVQGITEFLPISSSAHLIVVPKFVDWPDQGLLFDISVHVGTLAAVMLYFHKEVLQLFKGLGNVLCRRFETVEAKLFLMLLLSTIPLILIAPFIKGLIENYARSFMVIGFTSIFFGLLLWWADKKEQGAFTSLEKLTSKSAIFFGLFQALAMVPGTSRSGICMTAGRMLGFDRETASRYAMLMAMPVIFLIGANALVSDFDGGLNLQENLNEILVGVSVSFVSALLAIHGLMKFVNRIGFMPFVVYRIVLGAVLLFLAFTA